MKKIAIAVLFVSASLFATAQDITPEQIINKHIDAIGGQKAIDALQDVTITMSGEVQGQSLDIIQQKKAPNKSLMVGSISGMGEITKAICDGTKMSTTMMGNTQNIDGSQLKFGLIQSSIVPETEYAKNGVKATYAGKENLEGKECHKLDLSLGDAKWSEYYDVLTGLKFRQLLSQETPNGEVNFVITYSDYKETNGVRFANAIKQDTGMFVLDLKASKVEVNKGIADSVFDIK